MNKCPSKGGKFEFALAWPALACLKIQIPCPDFLRYRGHLLNFWCIILTAEQLVGLVKAGGDRRDSPGKFLRK